MFRSEGLGLARHAKSSSTLLIAFWVFMFGGSAAQDDTQPDTCEQERILKLMRQYAASYRYPDMSFDQSLTVFRGDSSPAPWQVWWKNEQRRITHDGHTYLCCRLDKHHKPIPNQWQETWYVPGAGSFPWDDTRASTAWSRWEVVRGHRVAVFDYTVSREDSHFIMPHFSNPARIPRQDGALYSGPVSDFRDSAVIPYKGSIWVDPGSGAIWRESSDVREIPSRFRVSASSTTSEYDLVTLGAEQYMLLVSQVMVHPGTFERVEYVWSNFRKFQADSSITFFGTDSKVIYHR
jgi:hypothetical protein